MHMPSIDGKRRNIMSEYKDIKNNTHAVIERVLKAENKQDSFTEEEIVEALFKIFSGKWSRESEYKFLFIGMSAYKSGKPPTYGGGGPRSGGEGGLQI